MDKRREDIESNLVSDESESSPESSPGSSPEIVRNQCKVGDIHESGYESDGIDNSGTQYEISNIHSRNLELVEIDSLMNIGSGTFSTVLQGYSQKYEQQVAIKIIFLRLKANKPYVRKYLTQEILLWRELSAERNDNILALKEYIQTSNYFYIITDLVDYGTLREFISRKQIKEDLGRSMFRNVVDALNCCHGHKIAHRDVKPENILMNKDLSVKLADFSFVTKKNPTPNDQCGTKLLLSPEQCTKKPYNPFISDVWQLGLTLYMMLYRKLPYKSHKKKQLLLEINELTNVYKNVPYPQRNSTSNECKELLSGMLAIDHQERLVIHEIKESKWLTGVT